MSPSKEMLEEHYQDLKEKKFFPAMLAYMLSGDFILKSETFYCRETFYLWFYDIFCLRQTFSPFLTLKSVSRIHTKSTFESFLSYCFTIPSQAPWLPWYGRARTPLWLAVRCLELLTLLIQLLVQFVEISLSRQVGNMKRIISDQIFEDKLITRIWSTVSFV